MKNQLPPNINKILDEGSLRGLFFLMLFASIVLAKCALSESLRLRYAFEVNTALFIWLPSLLIGTIVSMLYIAGPGSPFSSYWKSSSFILPATLIALATSFSVIVNLPSTIVPLLLTLLAAGICLTLGKFLHSRPVGFLAAFWIFGGWVALFLPETRSYGLFALLLIFFGAVPSAIAYFRYRTLATRQG